MFKLNKVVTLAALNSIVIHVTIKHIMVVTMVFKLNKVVTMVFPGICEDRVCRGAWAMHALVVAICGLLNN